MAKSKTGVEIIIRGFIETGADVEALSRATGAAVEARKTGDYSQLLGMMEVEDMSAKMRTRRPGKEKPGHVEERVDDVVDIEELIADNEEAA